MKNEIESLRERMRSIRERSQKQHEAMLEILAKKKDVLQEINNLIKESDDA